MKHASVTKGLPIRTLPIRVWSNLMHHALLRGCARRRAAILAAEKAALAKKATDVAAELAAELRLAETLEARAAAPQVQPSGS